MLLENKVAVIYGACGPFGAAVAGAFAREGAKVFLAGRPQAKLDAVADEIRVVGGTVETAVVDVLDERSVDAHLDAIVKRTGAIDISFNLVSCGDVKDSLTDVSVDDFTSPIAAAVRTQFLTMRAAARHMVAQGAGVILTLGGAGPQPQPGRPGFKVALDAVEGLRRQWARELAPHGVRVVALRSFGESGAASEPDPVRDDIASGLRHASTPGRPARPTDVREMAAHAAAVYARAAVAAATRPPYETPSEPAARRRRRRGDLTARERDVLRGVAAGRTDREIAEDLHLSHRTVTTHTSHIFAKLGVGNRSAAAVRAVQDRLV